MIWIFITFASCSSGEPCNVLAASSRLLAEWKKGFEMENNYVIQFPDLMKGKKILYVHGFCSSGSSGTVTKIREMLPDAEVVAPDLPLKPDEAMALLHRLCESERPDLIIGTSMGGMYAEMLYGYDRILVNPAFTIAENMVKNGMLGKNTFLNPRQDGVQEFILTKSMVAEYKEMAGRCFSGVTEDESRDRVFGLFGDNDPVVHTRDIFASHYRNDIPFHGEHRMNDKILLHSVVPVIRFIDDRQEGRERPIIYVSIDTLRDGYGNQTSSAMKAFNLLLRNYNLFVVAQAPTNDLSYINDASAWVQDVVGVPAWNRVVFTNRKDLLYGDYLIDPSEECGAPDFMGTRIVYGSDTFKTWEEIIEFFERLGGQ